MRTAQAANNRTRAWGFTLLSLGIFHIFPAQAQQNPITDVAVQDSAPQNHHRRHQTYRLIDLGTFGGPQSFVNIPAGYAPVLNNSGTVAGYADTSVPDPHPKFCFQDCFVAHAFRSTGAGKTDLGSLTAPIPTSSQPNWIADGGLIAGVSENGELDPLARDPSGAPFPEIRAVLWRKNGIVNLGTLEGGYESVATAVNDDGQVVGLFTNTIPDPNSMFGFGYQTRAFSWKDGVTQDLGTLGGTNAQAFVVNERGQVAGESYLNSDPSPACAMGAGLPLASGVFLWENGEMTNLGSFGGTCTVLGDLNDRGQIVGDSYLPGDQSFHAFLWENGTMKDLGNTFGGPSSNALAINKAGHVIGWGQAAGDKFVQHASLWKDGVQIDLGPSGTDCAFAASINSKDQIVGSSYPFCDFINPQFSGFIYENGELADLNTLVGPYPNLHISEPVTINDHGEIAGIGVTSDGTEHAFLLIPDGDCDDNCEARIATTNRDAAVALQASPTVSPGSSNPLHSRFGRLARRYHIPGAATPQTGLVSVPSAILSPTSLSFSTQAIGTTSAAQTVTLKNSSTTTLTIGRITITGTNAGDFPQTHTCGSSLAAGGSCTISVTFGPTASGTRTAALSVTDNAAGSPQKVSLTGIGTTAKLSPTSLNFGTVDIGTRSLAKTVSLTNGGRTTLTISAIGITGTNAGDFAQTHTCGSSLAAGASCSISVTFRPTASGSRTASLTVSDNAAGSPQQAALSGAGLFLRCATLGQQCYPSHPCCSGLACVPVGNRDYCLK